MDQLLIFEGKDPALQKVTARKTPGVKPTASVLAIGKRVKLHKNKIREVEGLGKAPSGKADPTPLQMAVSLPKGTPPDNRSIRHCFGIRKPTASTVPTEEELFGGIPEDDIEEEFDDEEGAVI